MVGSCKIFTYSANNKYANAYNNACNRFDNIRNKVIDYEQTHDDRESQQYQTMMDEFRYWDAQVPMISNLAGAEEERLKAQHEKKDLFHVNYKLDYYV